MVSGHRNNLQMKGGAGGSPHYTTHPDLGSLHVEHLYQWNIPDKIQSMHGTGRKYVVVLINNQRGACCFPSSSWLRARASCHRFDAEREEPYDLGVMNTRTCVLPPEDTSLWEQTISRRCQREEKFLKADIEHIIAQRCRFAHLWGMCVSLKQYQ